MYVFLYLYFESFFIYLHFNVYHDIVSGYYFQSHREIIFPNENFFSFFQLQEEKQERIHFT